jgi:hypothetical protein
MVHAVLIKKRIVPIHAICGVRIRITGKKNVAIRLGQEKLPRSICGPIIDNKKTRYSYFTMMIKRLRQAQDFVAHTHERADFTQLVAEGPSVDTVQLVSVHFVPA